jgi:hypothetical protein
LSLYGRSAILLGATYKVDATKEGRATATLKYTTSGPGPEFIFYLTGNGNPPLVVDFDNETGSVGKGIAYSQSSSPLSFNGPYGLYYTQAAFGGENDGTAQIIANGSAGTLSGVVDTNFLLSAFPNTPLTGTFSAIPTTG